MTAFHTFLLRLVLSILFSCVISILFFKEIRIFKTSLLAGIMLVLAYLFEFKKKRDRKDTEDF